MGRTGSHYTRARFGETNEAAGPTRQSNSRDAATPSVKKNSIPRFLCLTFDHPSYFKKYKKKLNR